MPDIDPITLTVLMDIVDSFHDLDDSDDQPFGNFARVERDGNVVTVSHETEDTPVVRIAVERIA